MDIVRIPKEQLLEFGIRPSFDTRVYFNHNKLVGDLFWRRFQKMLEMAEPSKKGVALDFGCGHGMFLPSLSKHYRRVIGIDIKTHPETKKILKYYGCNNVTVAARDGGDTRFKDNYFDVVFCADVLEHFRDLDVPLREIHRILKPNGRLIANSPLETWFFRASRALAGYRKPADHYHNAAEIYEKINGMFTIEEKYNYPNFFGKLVLLEIIKAVKE